MIATAPKKTVAKFPRAKIVDAIGEALKGKPFEIRVADASIGKMKIVRVVTEAWKSLRPSERIGKVLDVVNTKLTAQEQKGILRFSVLTPGEYQMVVGDRTTSSRKEKRVGRVQPVRAKAEIRRAG